MAIIRTRRRKEPRPSSRSGPVAIMTVHPDAMAEARRIMRPGERIVIVSETCVELRPTWWEPPHRTGEGRY
jgi:hypothetical protein